MGAIHFWSSGMVGSYNPQIISPNHSFIFYIHNMNVTNAIESNVLCPAVFRSVFGFSAWKIREGESDMGLNFAHESLVLVTST